jgi:hypothetical protein
MAVRGLSVFAGFRLWYREEEAGSFACYAWLLMSNHAHFLFRSVGVAYHFRERLVYIFMDCYNDHRDIMKVLDVPRLLKTRKRKRESFNA